MAIVGKGIGARHDAVCQDATEVRRKRSLRFVISAGSARILTRDHSLGIVLDVRSGRCS